VWALRYKPDGWLGMMMGTRLWYGFCGKTLSDTALFEGKVEEPLVHSSP
jgi:hypothetical protein